MKAWSFVLLLLCSLASTQANVAVLMQHNNLSRTGANLEETLLKTNNVNTNTFGLVFTRAVDDQIYAQPLIITNVSIPGKGVHNLLIVATVNDSVYAFDADDASVTNAYWKVSFTNATEVPPRNTDYAPPVCGGNYRDFSGNIGIVSTPAIDTARGVIFVLARTKQLGTNYLHKLHALDIHTGAEMPNSPVTITATYPGTGYDSVGGVVTFNPYKQNQRAALTLINGVVYICWASHCIWDPYHGWIMGFDATNLQRVVTFCTTPNGAEGGIWMAGQGPAADTNGNLYISIGNGPSTNTVTPPRPGYWTESWLKLTRSGTNLNVASYFTPYNWRTLEQGDIDLGTAGLLLIPGTNLAFSGGKQGVLYLVNRDNMGGLSGSTTADTNVVQSFQASPGNHQILGAPIWWDGPDGSYSYVWVSNTNFLQQFKFDWATGKFLLPHYSRSLVRGTNGTPGGILSLSANGTNAGSGIVWASHQLGGSANQMVRPGILRAFNAQNVTNELWNSNMNTNRDAVGNFAKFVPPTIANGKVYLATFSNKLNVYGLLPRPSLGISLSTTNVVLTWPTNTPAAFKLQSTTNLLGNWLDITNTATVTNGVYRATILVTNKTTYYRLKL